jgi:alpha-tubulin suppressor-like RCC1 family protein
VGNGPAVQYVPLHQPAPLTTRRGNLEFSCAVTLTRTVGCWGDNNFGELGNGTKTDSSTPVAVKGLANVVQVATGSYHACAVESKRRDGLDVRDRRRPRDRRAVLG